MISSLYQIIRYSLPNYSIAYQTINIVEVVIEKATFGQVNLFKYTTNINYSIGIVSITTLYIMP